MPRSRYSSNIADILDTVTRDTVVYFSVIFTSHFVLVLMLVFVRVRTRDVVWTRLFSPIPPSSRPCGSSRLCKFRSHRFVFTLIDTLPSYRSSGNAV